MSNSSDSPYSVGKAPEPTGGESFYSQFKTAKEEQDKASTAPASLPFPLQTIIDDIGNVFMKMVDIKDKVKRAKLSSKKRDSIIKLEHEIDNINKQLFKLTDCLYDIKS